MSGIFTKRRRLNPLFFLYCCLSVFPLAFTLNSNKCLKDKPEVIPKKYPHYMGYQTEITVESSNRVLHKLNTEIFKIFLEEVLGFARIKIVHEDDDFQLENIVDRLSPPVSDENVTFPTAMINLEVWVPPEYDTMNIEDVRLIKECGSIAPPGRFGWFIPMKLDMPVKQYYKRLTKNIQAVQEVHWTFLRDRDVVSAFDIDRVLMTKIVEPASKINDKEYYCMEKPCKRGMYVPSWCENDACAVLLTGHHNSSKFVVDHIKELHLFVKVIWLGSNLKHVTETLTNRTSPYKSIMVLHWTPSDVILREKNYISVAFKHCELLNSTKSVGCKYELNRLVKFAWSKLETLDKLLFQAIRSFKFDEKDFSFLLSLYENNSNTDLAELACMWMNKSESTWSGWKQDSDMTKIYIGGIFPITGSSYNGIGIVRGALMAKNIINNNPDILPDYRLELSVANGRCRPDGVMKSFIDYIVDGYYNNLIGVLGPACSDTVEPLAGVSKHYRIMVISYSAEGASFSDRVKYPYFFRTIGENKHYKHVYLQLFKKLGWKRIAALTEDGQKYTEYISHMQELLEENDVEIISNTKFPREKETFNMARYLEDLKRKRARIIILDVYDEIARTVMCEAYRLKMTSADGYVWFLPNWLNDTWYHTDYYNDYNHETVNCSTGEMIKAITGYFSMAHAFWAPDEAMVQGNMTVTEWKRAYENLTARSFKNKSGSYHDEMSNYAGFAYDAVWTYALALDKLIKMDPEAVSDIHSENTTNKLVQLVKDTDFNGVSGRIKFRGGPSRFSVIHLMEWYDNSSHIVGQFFPNLTDDTPEILGGHLNLNVTALKWFTPKRDIPMDGTEPPLSCTLDSLAKFFNVSCEMAVVILNIILLSFLMVFVMVTIFTIRYKYAKKVKITQKYMKHLGLDVLLSPTAMSDLDKWEIPRNSVVINRKLGEGAFGTVYGGEANLPEKGWVAVAVKTLKVGSNTEEKLDFLSEAEVMKRFDHKNIVKLLGVCTKEEPVYTIMEFMLYGDLKTFLLARRHLVNNKSVDESDEISSKKLTGIAVDVARGLSYLAELKYVHRDVASRNCLINAQRVVKLGDFGMTRPMVSNDYYKFTRKGMLPVRWMSPESLDVGKFTTASDVWSYGVLLYEIITFGSFPYQGMSNHQVLEYVKAGNTLSIPKGVKPQLEGLLKNCWHRDPKVRPRASEIVEFLANNPRLLAPCLDVPLASVQLEDPLEISLPDQFRKCSTTNVKNSPSIPNGISTYSVDERIPNERQKDLMPDGGGGGGGIPLENCCPKEPLLGTARSSSSLLNFGKFVAIQHGNRESPSKRISRSRDEEDDEESDYVAHNTANTFAVSKV